MPRNQDNLILADINLEESSKACTQLGQGLPLCLTAKSVTEPQHDKIRDVSQRSTLYFERLTFDSNHCQVYAIKSTYGPQVMATT